MFSSETEMRGSSPAAHASAVAQGGARGEVRQWWGVGQVGVCGGWVGVVVGRRGRGQ